MLCILYICKDEKDVDDESLSRVLTYNEVKSNTFVFMVAGYETTSSALAYCTYILANYPEVQKKLKQEIDQYFGDHSEQDQKKDLDYDAVNRMGYMEMFIKEVLRMYPIPVTGVSRQCMNETSVCGYKITKGSVVQADVFSVHYDPDLWGPHDPNEFYPERHEEKRHPLAYLPFGVGPRNCVGLRFAMIEMKIFLTRLLKQYTVVKCDKLEKHFNIREKIVLAPAEVWIKLH
ncbi:unnamed protein product [Didymodactylos carnosus]|uniref:Cytochrome P450 n=1 Tax=Didymodactylos carnosus TaxID=1234261 RepID=A0A814L786_9BILA|nr:unnamed protein product [Didymodactylos carnosus]CAF1060382.1 unnamed protein product [Didymodactylos carnosus]CAF3590504.1 unnamed protein product [Didymodactylos carnosus]CAF3828765.1 unnamed protein product [Didymodactylos carnosus]